MLEDQLAATQADLEAASAELMRTGNSLQHALRSKQVLMSWKLKAQPEVVGLRQKVQALKARQGQMEVRCPAPMSRLVREQATAFVQQF